MIKTEMDSMPAELDELSRSIMQLEIEEAALKKETDHLSQERLAGSAERIWQSCMTQFRRTEGPVGE